MSSITRRAAAALGVTLLSTPASAHGETPTATGLTFPPVAAGIVLVGLAGALVVVGSLYATAGRRYALATVLVVGVAAGWGVVSGVSPTTDAGLLALVGGTLLAVGTREGQRLHVSGVVPA